MRVALGQIDMEWENKEITISKAESMIREASDAKADIIVFPEMSFTGFSMNLAHIGEDSGDSYTRKRMEKLAVDNGIAIGFGWSANPGISAKKGTNRFTVLDEKGKTIAEYSKLHPFTFGGESETYQGGEQIVRVPFKGHVISLFICYDLRFPEIFQAASREADVLFVIANWPGVRSVHWETLLRARAIETQSYVVGVNCVGERDGICYSGESMAVDAIGNILGKISGREGILICELDDRAWSLRKKFATRADRREDLYMKFMEG